MRGGKGREPSELPGQKSRPGCPAGRLRKEARPMDLSLAMVLLLLILWITRK